MATFKFSQSAEFDANLINIDFATLLVEFRTAVGCTECLKNKGSYREDVDHLKRTLNECFSGEHLDYDLLEMFIESIDV